MGNANKLSLKYIKGQSLKAIFVADKDNKFWCEKPVATNYKLNGSKLYNTYHITIDSSFSSNMEFYETNHVLRDHMNLDFNDNNIILLTEI